MALSLVTLFHCRPAKLLCSANAALKLNFAISFYFICLFLEGLHRGTHSLLPLYGFIIIKLLNSLSGDDTSTPLNVAFVGRAHTGISGRQQTAPAAEWTVL